MDELVAFIEQGDDRQKKKKKRNKARRKLKKKMGETPTGGYEQGEDSHQQTHRKEDSIREGGGGANVEKTQSTKTSLLTSSVERLEEKESDGFGVIGNACEVEVLLYTTTAPLLSDRCLGAH